jgi:hypothetical protein
MKRLCDLAGDKFDDSFVIFVKPISLRRVQSKYSHQLPFGQQRRAQAAPEVERMCSGDAAKI